MAGSDTQALLEIGPFAEGFRLQTEALRQFHQLAAEIGGSECPVGPMPSEFLQVRRNVFSTFFLGCTRCLVGGDRFLPLYAMVNQCMRAWVTACDNLLDDENKQVLNFAFAGQGARTRAVLTLMLADRVLDRFILDRYGDADLVRRAGVRSLAALVPSALQECEEEVRPVAVLPSAEVLASVHHRKTGRLFAAPLALPIELEHPAAERAAAAVAGVTAFGMACQILDDAKDMAQDIAQGRHNLLVSLVSEDTGSTGWVEAVRREPGGTWESWDRYPRAARQALALARGRFADAFTALERIGITATPGQRRAVVATIHSLLGVPEL